MGRLQTLTVLAAVAAAAGWAQPSRTSIGTRVGTRVETRVETRAKTPGKTPVKTIVVELFTSEGCSSCPAADRLLAQLDDSTPREEIRAGVRRTLPPRSLVGRGIEVIALGEHVDYWDNLGWKDAFSSPLFSARQQDYGIAFHSFSVYTPQAVVQGRKEVLGSDARELTRAIREAAAAAQADVEIRRGKDGTIELRVGKLPEGSHSADVLLAVTESGIATDVGGGENEGRRLTHAAVVRTMSRLAEIDPEHPGEYVAEARLNLRPEWTRANLKVVLMVQDRETREILGAAALKP